MCGRFDVSFGLSVEVAAARCLWGDVPYSEATLYI